MTHTDTDIAEILERFDEKFTDTFWAEVVTEAHYGDVDTKPFKDFITRECLALKKKWEREYFDNQ